MLKKLIEKIVAAIIAVIEPLVLDAKADIISKIDVLAKAVNSVENRLSEIEQSEEKRINDLQIHIEERLQQIRDEKMEMQNRIEESIKQIQDDEKKCETLQAELQKDYEQKFNQLLDELNQKHETFVSEINNSKNSIIDYLPVELKEEALKQKEERIKKQLEVPKMETEEGADFEAMAITILRNAKQADVVIENELPSEVIQKLLITDEVTVNYEGGKLIVAKKEFKEDSIFDAETIQKEFEERKMLMINMKYNQILEKQMAYIKSKINELKLLYTKNPYQNTDIELFDEPENEAFIDECSIGGRRYKRFNFMHEVIEYLEESGIVLKFYSNSSSDYSCKFKEDMRLGWILSNIEVGAGSDSYLFDNRRSYYSFRFKLDEPIPKISLHVANAAEKNTMKK